MIRSQLSSLTAGWILASMASIGIALFCVWSVLAQQSELSARHADLQDLLDSVGKISATNSIPQDLPLDAKLMTNLLKANAVGGDVTISLGAKNYVAASGLVTREVRISMPSVDLATVISVLKYSEQAWPGLSLSAISIAEPKAGSADTASVNEAWDAEVVLTQVGDETISSTW